MKKWKFSKLTKYDQIWSKMTSSSIISKKTSKSPGKSSEVRILTNTNYDCFTNKKFHSISITIANRLRNCNRVENILHIYGYIPIQFASVLIGLWESALHTNARARILRPQPTRRIRLVPAAPAAPLVHNTRRTVRVLILTRAVQRWRHLLNYKVSKHSRIWQTEKAVKQKKYNLD